MANNKKVDKLCKQIYKNEVEINGNMIKTTERSRGVVHDIKITVWINYL